MANMRANAGTNFRYFDMPCNFTANHANIEAAPRQPFFF